MKNQLCKKCLLAGTCLMNAVYAVTPKEVKQNPQLVRVVREFAYKLSINYTSWPHFAVVLAHNAKRLLIDIDGNIVEPQLDLFLPTDKQIDSGDADFDRFYNRIEDWFRHNCCMPLPDSLTPYVRKEGAPRLTALANLLLAAFPSETANWPRRGIAANDNAKPPCKAANDNDLPR